MHLLDCCCAGVSGEGDDMRQISPVAITGADMFAGCGGTSTGLIDACNQRADEIDSAVLLTLWAINHWETAIETHKLNHPEVHHIQDEMENVNPLALFPDGILRLLVSSPECTHFSNARGGEPMNWQSRATCKYIIRWASQIDIQDLLVENVREFMTWGPLHRNNPNAKMNGRPIAKRKGQFFKAFVRKLQALGYRVEHALLCAADYGDPTSRTRFFLRARKGSGAISWPTPTHSPRGGMTIIGRTQPHRTAREIINWEDTGVSIFKPVHGPSHNRYLVANTMQRIFTGLVKFGGVGFVSPDAGICGAGDVVQPYLVMMYSTNDARSIDRAFPTQTTANHVALAQPHLVEFHNGKNREHRVKSLDKPLPTQDTSNRFGLAVPFVLGQQSAAIARDVDQPLPTIATAGAISLSQPTLVDPFLITMEHSTPASGHIRRVLSANAPMPTLTGRAAIGKVEPFITTVNHGQEAARAFPFSQPMPTLTSADGWALIEPQPYITKYYGTGEGQSTQEPIGAVTTHDRFALCQPGLHELPDCFDKPAEPDLPPSFGPFLPFVVRVGNHTGLPLLLPDGRWLLMDILFRMIKYPELARAHSLDNYRFVGSREQIVKQIGNSVPKRLAQALCYSALFS